MLHGTPIQRDERPVPLLPLPAPRYVIAWSACRLSQFCPFLTEARGVIRCSFVISVLIPDDKQNAELAAAHSSDTKCLVTSLGQKQQEREGRSFSDVIW
jgi:hypothetical protein